MILGALIAMAAASTAPSGQAFDICLVHLSNTPAFAAKSSEDLATDRSFFEAAVVGPCGEDAMALLPDDAEPGGLDMLVARWRAASAMRANPPPLSPEKRAIFRMLALFDEIFAPGNEERLVEPIECVADAIVDGASYINRDGVFLIAQLGPIAAKCRYDSAVDYMTGRVQALSPELDATAARRHADELMGSLILQARLAPRKGR
ncbi:MAG: hypothetical protein ACK4TG_06145 [Thermaurantiacus sp.]